MKSEPGHFPEVVGENWTLSLRSEAIPVQLVSSWGGQDRAAVVRALFPLDACSRVCALTCVYSRVCLCVHVCVLVCSRLRVFTCRCVSLMSVCMC